MSQYHDFLKACFFYRGESLLNQLVYTKILSSCLSTAGDGSFPLCYGILSDYQAVS